MMHSFVGRKKELEQWSNLLDDPSAKGRAVVVVGKYGMGKTWLLDQMIRQAQEHPSIQCCAARYIIGPGESPGMVLRVILDDMFQAARYKAGTLDAEGKRFRQWIRIYQQWELFHSGSPGCMDLLEQFRFDSQKNIFDQFNVRLKLLSDRIPEQSRLLLAIDPELNTLSARVELWAQVVKDLPPKIIFLFAQRFKDSLAVNEDFRALDNVHFIPSLEEQPQGLTDLRDDETGNLFDAYQPMFKDKSIDRQEMQNHFHLYRNHPFAVHAALRLLLLPGITESEQLPQEPMPGAVCPLLWRGITEHPLHEDAVPLFKAYAVLEGSALDEMVCWVADVPVEKLQAVLDDPFLGSMIRGDSDGRLLYHHHLMAYIRTLLYDQEGALIPEAERLHQRAMKGYADLANRAIKPDPLATVRLAEHALAVGGPQLFAETLRRYSELFLKLGFYQTYAALIDRALVLISPLSPEAADLHLQLGKLRHRQGDLPAAMMHYEESLQTARKAANASRIAYALLELGRISLENEHLVEAEMWLQEAVAYLGTENSKAGLADALLLSAEVQWIQGYIQKAEKFLQAAMDIAGGLRNRRQQVKMMSTVHAAWGRMFDQLGNVERATEQYYRAVNLSREIYDRETEAELQSSLGLIFERIGNLISAKKHITCAMDIHQHLKQMERWAEDNVRLARIAEMRGKPDVKNVHLDRARQMFRQLGNKQKLEELDK